MIEHKGRQKEGTGTIKGLFLNIVFVITYVFYAYFHLFYRFVFPRRMKSLDGEVFLITGSASGIGREVVYNLAKHHPKTTLVLWDANEAANKQVETDLKLLGVTDVFTYTVDVADRQQVEECAKRVSQEVGFVTILFNNAGVVTMGDLFSLDPERIEKTMSINVNSHFWTLRAFLPEMIKQSYGHVVTTCSLAGYFGMPYDAPYMASKYAVRGYLESVKAEVRNHPLKPKIRFTTIFPSFVKTPLIERLTVKYRLFSSLFEPMEPKYVAEKIIEGIQRNEENVVLPKIGELYIIIKALMPRRVTARLEDYMMENIKFAEEKN